MKALIIANHDFANVMSNWTRFVNEQTSMHSVKLFVINKHPLLYESVAEPIFMLKQEDIDEADVIMFNEFLPGEIGLPSLIPPRKMVGKRVVYSWQGTTLRESYTKEIEDFVEKNRLNVIVPTPDLLYSGPDGRTTWVPQSVPMFDPLYEAKPLSFNFGEHARYVIGHAAVTTVHRQTARFVEAFADDPEVVLSIVTHVPHEGCLRLKRNDHLSFVSLAPYGIGISSMESMSMGTPVATVWEPKYRSHHEELSAKRGWNDDIPYIHLDPDNFVEQIKSHLDPLTLVKLGLQSREWIEKVLHPSLVADDLTKAWYEMEPWHD